MASEEKEFNHESIQDRDSIVRYLSALGEGLRSGKLQLSSNGQQLSLETPALVKFDVEAKQKRNRAQLVLRISWKHSKSTRELRVEPLSIAATEKTNPA